MKVNPIRTYSIQTKFNNKNISFNKNMNELIYPFGYDLIKYSTLTDTVSLKGIEGIIQKYSPKTKVDLIENYQERDTRKPLALLNSLYEFSVDNDGETYVYPSSKTVYIGLNNAKNESLGAFLAQVIHEATHLFQQEADDRTNYEHLYENYLNNILDKQALKNTIDIIDEIFMNLETYMSAGYTMCDKKGLKTDDEINQGFVEQFGFGVDEAIQYIILSTISDNGDKKVNFNFIFDYCIMRSENEIEAYQNMLDFRPKLLINKEFEAQIKTMLKMYNKIMSELAEMRKKYSSD